MSSVQRCSKWSILATSIRDIKRQQTGNLFNAEKDLVDVNGFDNTLSYNSLLHVKHLEAGFHFQDKLRSNFPHLLEQLL